MKYVCCGIHRVGKIAGNDRAATGNARHRIPCGSRRTSNAGNRIHLILEERQGRYAGAREQLGGILVFEARDLNHAIPLISQQPGGVK